METIKNLQPLNRLLMTWQHPVGRQRFVVGEVLRVGEAWDFCYLNGPQLKAAQAGGFSGYPAFPMKESVWYKAGVAESFGTRLLSPQRSEYADYLRYWFISPESNPTPFDLLGYTGGALPRDTFRFLPVLPETRPADFVMEVAGVRHQNPQVVCQVGDRVQLKAEPDNDDPEAVAVVDANSARLGYVMRGLNTQALNWLQRGHVFGHVVRWNGTVNYPVVLAHLDLP